VQRIVGKGFMMWDGQLQRGKMLILGNRKQEEEMEENAQMLMRESWWQAENEEKETRMKGQAESWRFWRIGVKWQAEIWSHGDQEERTSGTQEFPETIGWNDRQKEVELRTPGWPDRQKAGGSRD
jgi:hypothetical protein